MENSEAVLWLQLCQRKGVRFNDNSPDTQYLREEATKSVMEAFDMAIKALTDDEMIPIQWLWDLSIELKRNGSRQFREAGRSMGIIIGCLESRMRKEKGWTKLDG